jgi:hypothetical protein
MYHINFLSQDFLLAQKNNVKPLPCMKTRGERAPVLIETQHTNQQENLRV